MAGASAARGKEGKIQILKKKMNNLFLSRPDYTVIYI